MSIQNAVVQRCLSTVWLLTAARTTLTRRRNSSSGAIAVTVSCTSCSHLMTSPAVEGSCTSSGKTCTVSSAPAALHTANAGLATLTMNTASTMDFKVTSMMQQCTAYVLPGPNAFAALCPIPPAADTDMLSFSPPLSSSVH